MKKYPLSQAQLGVFLECLQFPNSTQYNLPFIAKLDKAIDVDKLALAWQNVIKTHAIYRNRYEIDADGIPWQWSDDAMPINIVRRKCTKLELDDYVMNSFVRPYNILSGKPLFRIEIAETEEGNFLLLDMHHTITDGSGIFILTEKDINKFYLGYRSPVDYSFYELAEKETGLTDTPEYTAARKYFTDKFFGKEFVTLSNVNNFAFGRMVMVSEYIDKKICDDFCEKYNLRIDRLFNLAFCHAVGAITRNEKIAYGTAYHGRNTAEKKNTAGMFVNTVAVIADVSGNQTVNEALANIDKELKLSFANAIYPVRHLSNDLHQSPKMLFNFRATKQLTPQHRIADCIIELTELLRSMTQSDIVVSVILSEDKYHIRIESSSARNTKESMTTLAKAIKTTIHTMLANPEAKLKDIHIITEDEAKELTILGTGEIMERDRTETIVSIFKDRAATTPNATAVVYKDKSHTYAELDEITNNLAVYLSKNYDIKPEENVGVLINRSEWMLIYPLAIMKTGAAYMPLDPHFPTDRLKFMCEDAGVKIILSEGNLLKEKLPAFTGNNFYSSDLKDIPKATVDKINSLTAPKANNRMIVLYTSGSTGMPKAVELEHYGIANYCHWYVSEFKLTPADHVAGYANFGFDAHMIDLYPSILAGSAVYIFDDEMRMDVNGMNSYMEENKISVAFMTTQVGCIIKDINHSLRYLSTGGEKMPPVTPPDFRFLNVYGPTECSLFTTYYDVKGFFKGEYIGRPLANYQLYVIDQNCRQVPKGVVGELLIAGEGVARGYMNRPQLTAEKFIMFKPSAESEPCRAYRSGDLVRWAEDGNLEYLGRIDKQVKLRGLRIELGEIENQIVSYEGVKQAVAEVKNDTLCCYYVANSEIDKDKLKEHLAKTLTEFMIPEVYMQLDKMPLNANGKIDRRALPEPQLASNLENIAPANVLEEQVLKIAKELLPNIEFGVTDDLQLIGLNSIKAMRLTSRINTELSLRLRVADIMRHRNIREILIDNRNISWFFHEYDASKTTLVLHHGVVTIFALSHLYPVIAKYFNLFIIEPTDNHYKEIFEGKYLDEVVDFYHCQIETNLPKDAEIFAFMGFSFGGELSFMLADKWAKVIGKKPLVIMGDTILTGTQDLQPKDIKHATLTQEVIEFYKKKMPQWGQEITEEICCELAEKEVLATNMVSFLQSKMHMSNYSGHVVFLNSHLDYDDATMTRKLSALDRYAEDYEVIDFPEIDHYGLFILKSLDPFYDELFARLIMEYGRL